MPLPAAIPGDKLPSVNEAFFTLTSVLSKTRSLSSGIDFRSQYYRSSTPRSNEAFFLRGVKGNKILVHHFRALFGVYSITFVEYVGKYVSVKKN